MKKMQYEFKSTFQNSSLNDVEVDITDGRYEFVIDEVKNTIIKSEMLLIRESKDFVMEFDMKEENGSIEIPEVNQRIEFSIFDIKFDVAEIVNIEFKYILEDEEVFVSLLLK